MESANKDIKNILVVNVNWLGDVIFSSPIFRAIKKNYPNAKVSCLAVPRVKEVLELVPDIDEVIIYDEDKRHKGIIGKVSLIFHLRKKNFDIAFLLHKSLTRALLVFLAGIPNRVGYDSKNRGIFLTHRIKMIDGNRHRSDEYINVIESFGVKVDDRTTELFVDEEAERELDRLLLSNGIAIGETFVVINPGGNWDPKRWPIKNFSLLVSKLINEDKVKVVISGASKDIPLVQEILKYLEIKPIILSGELNIKQLVLLMKKAKVVISADSGPLHIASSVGTKTIGMFGPTRIEITGTRGKGESVVLQKDIGCNRKPCYYLDCKNNLCMQAITVYDVIEEFRQIKDK